MTYLVVMKHEMTYMQKIRKAATTMTSGNHLGNRGQGPDTKMSDQEVARHLQAVAANTLLQVSQENAAKLQREIAELFLNIDNEMAAGRNKCAF